MAVGLLVGANAWAEESAAVVKMTYVDSDNPETAIGEVETAKAGYNKIAGDEVGFGNTSWGCNWITYLQVDASTISGTIIGATLTFDGSGSTDSKRQTKWGVGYNSKPWSANMTYTSADKKIVLIGEMKTTTTKASTEFESFEFDITEALKNADGKIATILVYETEAAGGYIKNPAVAVTYTTAAAADYTIKYVAGDVELGERTETGIVGEVPTLDASKDKIKRDLDGQRYLYDSDNASTLTVANDGSTVVTVNYREAAKKNYTVTASYTVDDAKKTLDWTATGFIWEDETYATIRYPRVLADGATFVEKAPNNNNLTQSATIAEDGATVEITYTASATVTNLYLLKEAENLGSTLTESATTYTDRISNGKIIYGAEGDLLTLPAGKYILTLGVIGGAGNSWTFKVAAGDLVLIDDSHNANTLGLKVSQEFELVEETTLSFTASNSTGDRGIDLLYVQKTGDVELPEAVTVEIGATGWATLASKYALDLSDVTAYYAYDVDATEKVVKVTSTTAAVKGNTGLILKGEANTEVTIPVVAAGVALEGNLLVGCAAEKELEAAANLYVLVANGDAAEFQSLATNGATVDAGKAYLSVPASEDAAEARLTIAIDGETTGIAEVEKANTENGAIYNLAGQRVAQPANGLYIVNGKKVIIK